MGRVTKLDLQLKIDYLNKLTGKGYFLSQQCGGYAVTRKVNERGGESHLFRHLGHMPAAELFIRLSAYLQGIEDTVDAADKGHHCERCGTFS
jgi:hypothetical protein